MNGKNKPFNGKLYYICAMPSRQIPIQEIIERLPIECKLTVLQYDGLHYSITGKTRRMVKCVCHCGEECNAIVGDLLRGKKYTCGCGTRGRKPKYKYGGKPFKKLKQLHTDLINRHVNKKHVSYKYYGGKGCKVCPEWLNYDVFSEWCINNGWADGLQIDKDIKGNGMLYSPETCVFVTAYENSINRSTSKKYLFNGKLLTLSQIADNTNIPYTLLKCRVINNNKTIEDAVKMGCTQRQAHMTASLLEKKKELLIMLKDINNKLAK